jgi:sugar phosphate isomerase/epimerase
VFVPGICSVTLRALPAVEVVAIAADAALAAVEWGGDVHVPPGDLATAERVRAATARSGLVVASYGSYFRVGVTDPAEAAPVVATARELGAPRIRVWAGDRASTAVTGTQRSAVADGARRMVEQAAEAGIEVAFEFHGDTLTDDPGSALALLAEVPGAGTYWQPPNGLADQETLAGLDEVAPAVAAVHVFSWWPGTRRRRLIERDGLWRGAVERLRAVGRDLDMLLEFVPGDDPALVREEGSTLRSWIGDGAADD